jgi:hypothetical protein
MHLYDYLMSGAKRRENYVAAEILSDGATVVDDLVGPFRLQATHSFADGGGGCDRRRRRSEGDRSGGARRRILRPGPIRQGRCTFHRDGAPATSNGFGGRVITGVARDDSNSRLTPVALAMPAPLVVDFAIYVERRSAVAR